MIRNRLAELLSERGLRITQVAKDTNLSRNTITSTAQNDSKMIQYETINELCNYLGVSPGDFFEHIPIDLEYSSTAFDFYIDFEYNKKENIISKINSIDYEFELTVNVLKKSSTNSLVLRGKTILQQDNSITIQLTFNNKSDISFYNELLNEIPVGFWHLLREDFIKRINATFRSKLNIWLIKNLDNYSNIDRRHSPLMEIPEMIIPINEMTTIEENGEKIIRLYYSN